MLNNRINTLRLAFGWSQVELAKRLCVSKQAVSNWENDNIQPSIEMLIRLADTFGVTTDFLLGREEIPRLNLTASPPAPAPIWRCWPRICGKQPAKFRKKKPRRLAIYQNRIIIETSTVGACQRPFL